jgi:acyl carrier protein
VAVGISEEDIRDDTRLRSDLELDSTETVEISLEFKKRFGVDVKLESAQDLTIQQVCELVEQALARTPHGVR